MNTRFLMIASAIFLMLLGLVLLFLPQETLVRFGSPPVPALTVVMQLAGALYTGFAMLNWAAQATLIGGIYSRPVALGNLVHFAIGALSALHFVLGGYRNGVLLAVAVLYLVFAIAFGFVVFTHPRRV